jgi:hypothetical protein
MLKLIESAIAPSVRPSGASLSIPFPLRSVRPSLLDLRFTGDPWVVDHRDGTSSVKLDDYRLARIQTLSFDLPSLNRLWMQLRQCQMRRRSYRQLGARGS